MKRLVIIGASGHGKVIADVAVKNGYEDIVFLDDNESLTECAGVPVVRKISEVVGVFYDSKKYNKGDLTMEKKRLWQQLHLLMIPGSKKRVEYLKKNHVFRECGENVYLQSRKIPLYANLISLHNNIRIASDVTFLTHDVMHTVFSNVVGKKFQEKVGCIEIFDNVFIGSHSVIMYDTKIGPNVIVAAGSVVTKDIPPGSVVGGYQQKLLVPSTI